MRERDLCDRKGACERACDRLCSRMRVSISFPSRLLAKCGAELSADFVLPSHVPFSHCLTSPQTLSSKTVQSRTESTAQTPASEMAALTAHPPDGKTEPLTLLTHCLQAPRRPHPHPCRKCTTKVQKPEGLADQCFPIAPVTAENRLKVCTKALTL